MKTALITGGSRGIGRACVLAFAQAGWQVAWCYRKEKEQSLALEQELKNRGFSGLGFAADVADSGQVEALFSQIEQALGPVDALVCNAGVAYQGLLSDMTDEDWRRVMGVDLDGVFYCCRRAIPSMVRRQKGSILTISSMWGLTGGSCEAAYSAAKAGVIGLTKALAKELGPSGVRVNCIAPGVIHTQMNGNLTQEDRQILADETPLCRLGTPEEVAKAALFLSQEDASFITGQVLAVDGGIAI